MKIMIIESNTDYNYITFFSKLYELLNLNKNLINSTFNL